MELNEINLFMIIWQIIIFVGIIFLLFFTIKFIKKLFTYLDLKIKYLNKKMDL